MIIVNVRKHRTDLYKRCAGFIYAQANELRSVEKRKEDSRSENPLGTPNRAVLEPILADLDRLWEMRHWIPNPGEPISPLKRIG